jgi:Transposase DDE domain
MITDFDDFCLWMYCIVDDIWQQVEPLFKRPGPAPLCSDSELMTMAVVGECKGWATETNLLSEWAQHKGLFRHIPSQSRFNRRRRHLTDGFNLVRRAVLGMLEAAADGQCAIDSLPVPVVNFHLAPCASREWAAYGASYGTVSTKREKIYGYKLHLLVTLSGVVLDFELAPANASDLHVGAELLQEHTDLVAVADKAYVSAPVAQALSANNRIELLTLPRANQKRQLSPPVRKLINSARQIIETVNGQLAAQLGIERNYAHTFWGLCARLHTKLAAHTLCIHINCLLGKADFLCIKSLAFPI